MSEEDSGVAGDGADEANAAAQAQPGGEGRADISDEEVDALLETEKDAGAAAGRGIVVPYDLVARDKIVRGRMPVLDRITERWNTEFQRRLSDLIRRPVEAEIQPVEIAPFGEWQARNTGLTSFNIYAVRPWQRNAMIALDGSLLFALVDAYYGGNGQTGPTVREELTPTERRLNTIIVTFFVDHFRNAFAPIAALDFVHQKTETNPHYAEIATSSESVVINRMNIVLGDVQGSLSLVLPLSMFDSVRDKLTEALKSASRDEQRRWYESLRRQLDSTELELATVFLRAEITMRELLMLKPGDVLPIEMPKTATLFAGSRPLFSAKFGLSRGYNAVSIVGPATEFRSDIAKGGEA